MKRSTFFVLLSHGCIVASLGYYSLFGPHGVIAYIDMKKNINSEIYAIQKLKNHITNTKNACRYYQSSIAQEQIIRYDLCMGYTNEQVYILTKSDG